MSKYEESSRWPVHGLQDICFHIARGNLSTRILVLFRKVYAELKWLHLPGLKKTRSDECIIAVSLEDSTFVPLHLKESQIASQLSHVHTDSGARGAQGSFYAELREWVPMKFQWPHCISLEKWGLQKPRPLASQSGEQFSIWLCW